MFALDILVSARSGCARRLCSRLCAIYREKMSVDLHRGRYIQRGRGVGSILVSLFRGLAPMLKAGAKTAVKSALRGSARTITKKGAKKLAKRALSSVGKSAAKAGMNAAVTALEGGDVKAGAKRDLLSARRDLGATIKRSAKTAFPASNKKKAGKRGRPKRGRLSLV